MIRSLLQVLVFIKSGRKNRAQSQKTAITLRKNGVPTFSICIYYSSYEKTVNIFLKKRICSNAGQLQQTEKNKIAELPLSGSSADHYSKKTITGLLQEPALPQGEVRNILQQDLQSFRLSAC